MDRRWCGIATWIVLSAQLACSCSSSDEEQQPSGIESGGSGGAAASGSGGAGGGTGGAGAGGAGAGGAGTSGLDGGGGTAGDAEDGGTQAACDPNAGGRVSRPGAYEGYGEVLYDGYEMTSQYVEVRDGTRLAMDLFRPTDGGELVTEPLPVLFMHTPYNRRTFLGGMAAETYPGYALRLVPYGYVVAVVDFRGVYASFGKNVAYNRGEWIDAARMDAYDVTEWLASQPWSSGKIGMWGCSATGGSQLQAATTAPPHLKAIFPMSCEFDAYPFGVPGGMARAEGNTSAPPAGLTPELRDAMAVPVDGAEGAALLADAIAEHADNVENAGYVPYRDSIAENIPEQWWLKSSPHTYLEEINRSGIAIYAAANWNEGMTKYGAFFTLNNVTTPVKLLVGPAGHCEWSTVKQDTGFDLVIEERRFFDHWLKGIDNCVMHEPKVHYYTYNAAPGEEWQSAEAWPLPGERRTRYYFGEGSLSTTATTASEGMDAFEVEYAVTPENRAETGLVYATEPLATAVQVTGHPVVELWISSTAADGDFVVTLEDVAPDGTATSYFMNGRLRASHRALADAPYENLGLPWHPHTEAALEPLVPGEPVLLTFDLLPISIVFAAGHRIRVIVNFADAVTPVLEPAPTVTVYRDAERPSSITLPIID